MTGPGKENIPSNYRNRSGRMVTKKIKVITGKIGLDDHFRGIIAVTEAFRDAGMEVVYLGIGQRA